MSLHRDFAKVLKDLYADDLTKLAQVVSMMRDATLFDVIVHLIKQEKQNGKHRQSGAQAHGNSNLGAGGGSGGSRPQPGVPTGFIPVTLIFPGPEPDPIPHAGIRAGEITGHRLWWLIWDGGLPCLSSLVTRKLWQPGLAMIGDIEQVIHPTFNLFGGVYAYRADNYELERECENLSDTCVECDLRGATGRYRTTAWDVLAETTTFVRGTVKMWGEVVEHHHGYRAQFAKVNSIDRIYNPKSRNPRLHLSMLQARYLG